MTATFQLQLDMRRLRQQMAFAGFHFGMAWVTSVVTSACQIVGGYKSFEARPPHPCDVLPPTKIDERELATMVLSRQPDGSCYWIDKTEVTVEQYRAFIEDVDGKPYDWEPVRCAWKGTASPSNPLAGDECADEANPEAEPFFDVKPIRCVDWCDSKAFCSWASKELCVGQANAAGLFEPSDLPDQWGNACSDDGLSLPYGTGTHPKAGVCNVGFDEDNGECFKFLKQWVCGPTSVDSLRECEGPAGAVDMIGNVAEWVLSCTSSSTSGARSACQVRGGSFVDGLDTARCYSYEQPTPLASTRRRDLGLRCCANLTPRERSLVK